MVRQKKIAVIGAGASGLTAIKSCKEENLLPVCFERSSALGGLWRYHEDDIEGIASVMRTTIINTSKEKTAFSDFPPDAAYPNYMHNTKMLDYFTQYDDHFDLRKHIRFNSEVLKVQPADDFNETGRWMISTRCTQTAVVSEEAFDAVMICIGHHVFPKIPIFPNQHIFKGTITHTHSLKSCDRFKGKKVAVIGIGNSGLDAAVDATYAAEQVYLSTRRGAWIYSRVGPNGNPIDLSRTRWNAYLNSWKSFENICDKAEKELNSKFDHAAYNLKPKHRIFSTHPTVSDAIPSAILSGRVVIKGDVERFEEDGIVFDEENDVTAIDVVVLATGYLIKFPFLDDSLVSVKNNRVHLYKYIIPPQLKHSTLAFIGFVQPLGSIMPISEMQSRWFVQLLVGNLQLPSVQDMEMDILKKKEAMVKRYVDSTRHTIQVDILPYMDELAEMIGVKPNLWKLALKDPKLFWTCLTGSTLSYQYRLEGLHTWSGARNAILKYKERIDAPLNQHLQKASQNRSIYGQFFNVILFILITIVIVKISLKL